MYAVLSDLQARYETDLLIQLTDENREGVINQARVAVAIADAERDIDSYLGTVYDLPLAGPPAVLTGHTCIIARYKLEAARGTVPDGVQAEYDATLKWLRLVSDGKIKLDVGGSEPASAPEVIVVQGAGRVFSRDSMGGY